MLLICSTSRNINPERKKSLDHTVGAEMNKTRPAVIVSDDRLGKLPLKIIVPVTDWKEHYSVAPWMIAISTT